MYIIDDPKLDEILTTISNVACPGIKGDGKIFVITVDNRLDIFTKKCGT